MDWDTIEREVSLQASRAYSNRTSNSSGNSSNFNAYRSSSSSASFLSSSTNAGSSLLFDGGLFSTNGNNNASGSGNGNGNGGSPGKENNLHHLNSSTSSSLLLTNDVDLAFDAKSNMQMLREFADLRDIVSRQSKKIAGMEQAIATVEADLVATSRSKDDIALKLEQAENQVKSLSKLCYSIKDFNEQNLAVKAVHQRVNAVEDMLKAMDGQFASKQSFTQLFDSFFEQMNEFQARSDASSKYNSFIAEVVDGILIGISSLLEPTSAFGNQNQNRSKMPSISIDVLRGMQNDRVKEHTGALIVGVLTKLIESKLLLQISDLKSELSLSSREVIVNMMQSVIKPMVDHAQAASKSSFSSILSSIETVDLKYSDLYSKLREDVSRMRIEKIVSKLDDVESNNRSLRENLDLFRVSMNNVITEQTRLSDSVADRNRLQSGDAELSLIDMNSKIQDLSKSIAAIMSGGNVGGGNGPSHSSSGSRRSRASCSNKNKSEDKSNESLHDVSSSSSEEDDEKERPPVETTAFTENNLKQQFDDFEAKIMAKLESDSNVFVESKKTMADIVSSNRIMTSTMSKVKYDLQLINEKIQSYDGSIMETQGSIEIHSEKLTELENKLNSMSMNKSNTAIAPLITSTIATTVSSSGGGDGQNQNLLDKETINSIQSSIQANISADMHSLLDKKMLILSSSLNEKVDSELKSMSDDHSGKVKLVSESLSRYQQKLVEHTKSFESVRSLIDHLQDELIKANENVVKIDDKLTAVSTAVSGIENERDRDSINRYSSSSSSSTSSSSFGEDRVSSSSLANLEQRIENMNSKISKLDFLFVSTSSEANSSGDSSRDFRHGHVLPHAIGHSAVVTLSSSTVISPVPTTALKSPTSELRNDNDSSCNTNNINNNSSNGILSSPTNRDNSSDAEEDKGGGPESSSGDSPASHTASHKTGCNSSSSSPGSKPSSNPPIPGAALQLPVEPDRIGAIKTNNLSGSGSGSAVSSVPSISPTMAAIGSVFSSTTTSLYENDKLLNHQQKSSSNNPKLAPVVSAVPGSKYGGGASLSKLQSSGSDSEHSRIAPYSSISNNGNIIRPIVQTSVVNAGGTGVGKFGREGGSDDYDYDDNIDLSSFSSLPSHRGGGKPRDKDIFGNPILKSSSSDIRSINNNGGNNISSNSHGSSVLDGYAGSKHSGVDSKNQTKDESPTSNSDGSDESDDDDDDDDDDDSKEENESDDDDDDDDEASAEVSGALKNVSAAILQPQNNSNDNDDNDDEKQGATPPNPSIKIGLLQGKIGEVLVNKNVNNNNNSSELKPISKNQEDDENIDAVGEHEDDDDDSDDSNATSSDDSDASDDSSGLLQSKRQEKNHDSSFEDSPEKAPPSMSSYDASHKASANSVSSSSELDSGPSLGAKSTSTTTITANPSSILRDELLNRNKGRGAPSDLSSFSSEPASSEQSSNPNPNNPNSSISGVPPKQTQLSGSFGAGRKASTSGSASAGVASSGGGYPIAPPAVLQPPSKPLYASFQQTVAGPPVPTPGILSTSHVFPSSIHPNPNSNSPNLNGHIVPTSVGANDTIQCSQCMRRIPRRDLTAHMKNCELRKESCRHGCGFTARVFQISAHEAVCERKPLSGAAIGSGGGLDSTYENLASSSSSSSTSSNASSKKIGVGASDSLTSSPHKSTMKSISNPNQAEEYSDESESTSDSDDSGDDSSDEDESSDGEESGTDI